MKMRDIVMPGSVSVNGRALGVVFPDPRYVEAVLELAAIIAAMEEQEDQREAVRRAQEAAEQEYATGYYSPRAPTPRTTPARAPSTSTQEERAQLAAQGLAPDYGPRGGSTFNIPGLVVRKVG